jgi:hypothetical protein
MFERLRIPVLCIIIMGLSYYPMSFIGLRTSVEAREISEKEENPGHKKCPMCGGRHHRHSGKRMMALAFSAGEELLKEKMKENLEKKAGERLDRVADVLVDAMIEKYRKVRECRKEEEELRQQLEEAFRTE